MELSGINSHVRSNTVGDPGEPSSTVNALDGSNGSFVVTVRDFPPWALDYSALIVGSANVSFQLIE